MGDLEAQVKGHIENILKCCNDIYLHSEEIFNSLKLLRNLCACRPNIQLQIALNEDLKHFLSNLLFSTEQNGTHQSTEKLQVIGWQLLANMVVNNLQSLTVVWNYYGKTILNCLDTKSMLGRKVDIMLMIIYNVMKSPSAESLLQLHLVLRSLLRVWQSILEQKYSEQLEFLHFNFEEFLVRNGRDTVKFYVQLSSNEKVTFLDYLCSYLRQDNPNGLVHTFIIQHISKEFKMKSDCILRVASLQETEQIMPLEAYALLRCVASASGSESYSELYFKDHSLFLNVSSLLRCLIALSKENRNSVFSPMNKLEDVAPTSNIPSDFQSEISFELKTLLVRCIANLLYNNDTNKRYCLDTELLPALLECTNMDARNPLMKEWSILAIRNACVGCLEVQQVIANLTQKGPANNDLLTDFDLDMGSLRINPCKE